MTKKNENTLTPTCPPQPEWSQVYLAHIILVRALERCPVSTGSLVKDIRCSSRNGFQGINFWPGDHPREKTNRSLIQQSETISAHVQQ